MFTNKNKNRILRISSFCHVYLYIYRIHPCKKNEKISGGGTGIPFNILVFLMKKTIINIGA
jgi:hypothetical protein